MSITLDLLVLKSSNLDSLRSFYEALGFTFAREQHGQGPEHFSTAVADTVLELYPLAPGAAPSGPTRLGFSIPDLDRVLASIESTDGQVIKMPAQTPRGYLALVRDPDGRVIELLRR